ncbi:leucine--tRNA ligase, putative [Plasmodium knowlesi strain H]|uniref:leucine--tRNA ligase n=3 Tax=Plasmodium knowlesi TaxID=5850 RepID=A0A5K1UCE2_PLAKH|nr:leucine--tRNA ligase, putative [Plasmodium knowlesi strain H]OTN68154.1 putative Leucine--tRNA ligase [Plasmodium knowlesi]CAA9990261.1 leucine--tRNA ligase, putative [Plasmodium knowlesi strain H]SBO26777.1 leucine--tRNA ligase, putative [Plasmodium knowlesi strain H]SBO28418.1 leucine--tRNA ligase, putative [Plasmodium knowlesi strain H]VVS79735.1 leucine--tRNA ligase, putative [Plasmodium knowlesi strain H]|eukprot:XP_002258040.1 leucine-trna ligase, putative [Plasmodium knowlesi strain H]
MPLSWTLTLILCYLLLCETIHHVFAVRSENVGCPVRGASAGCSVIGVRAGYVAPSLHPSECAWRRARRDTKLWAYNFRAIERKWQVVWNSKRLLDRDFARFNRNAQAESQGEGEKLAKGSKVSKVGRVGKGEWKNEESVGREFEEEERRKTTRRKFYILDMFPYPSAQGLHMGHILCFTITDVLAKFKRMTNHCVFHPIGWDSFGLPCDRMSMKLKVDPREIIQKNILNFKEQVIKMGFLFNWDNEINTSDEIFYKWTQWIFIQMYLKKLGYKKNSYVNWSKEIKCVISNDEMKNEANVEGLKVTKRKLLQWYLRITKYATRLIEDLKEIDWPEKIKRMQINWIGKKKGIILKAKVIPIHEWKTRQISHTPSGCSIPHVLYHSIYENDEMTLLLNYLYHTGGYGYDFFYSFVRMGGEKYPIEWVENQMERLIQEEDAVENSLRRIKPSVPKPVLPPNKGEKKYLLNFDTDKEENEGGDLYVKIFLNEKEAIFPGDKLVVSVNHPKIDKIVNGKKCLLNFVRRGIRENDTERLKNEQIFFTGSVIYNPIIGKYIPIYVCTYVLENNSDLLFVKRGRREKVEETSKGEEALHKLLSSSRYSKKYSVYNLKDWLFSRQRYWGEPFPFLFPVGGTKEGGQEKGEIKNVCNSPVEGIYIDDIPVHLPKFHKRVYELGSNRYNEGSPSVLSRFKNWVFQRRGNVLYKRECDIMPQWAGSSWYFLRYLDSKNSNCIFNKERANLWMPVDLYVGGSEHAVLHLLYARFFHKFLYDLKLVKHKEPFQRLFNQGLLLSASSFFAYTTLEGKLVSYAAVRAEAAEGDKIEKEGGTQQRQGSVESNITESNPGDDVLIGGNGEPLKEKQIYPSGAELSSDKQNCSIEKALGEKVSCENEKYRKYRIPEELVVQREGKYFLKDTPDVEVKANYEKMSKSRGNTVNPNDIVKKYGSDCLRLYILFLGPIDQNKKWDLKGIKGTFKFLTNLYNLFVKDTSLAGEKRQEEGSTTTEVDSGEIPQEGGDSVVEPPRKRNSEHIICTKCRRKKRNQHMILNFEMIKSGGYKLEGKFNPDEKKEAIKRNINFLRSEDHSCKELSDFIVKKKVQDIETEKKERANFFINKITKCLNNMKLNTAVSFFMIFFNEIKKWDYIPLKIFLVFVKLLFPFCPHICEEFWFFYLKKYKAERKQICYFCNSSLMYFARWPSLFELESAKVSRLSIRLNNRHVTFMEVARESGLEELRSVESCEHSERPTNGEPSERSEKIIREATNKITDRIEKEKKKGKRLVNVMYIPNKVVNFVFK